MPVRRPPRNGAGGDELLTTDRERGKRRSHKMKEGAAQASPSTDASQGQGAQDSDEPFVTDQPDYDVQQHMLTANLDRMSEEGLLDMIHPDGVNRGLLGIFDDEE